MWPDPESQPQLLLPRGQRHRSRAFGLYNLPKSHNWPELPWPLERFISQPVTPGLHPQKTTQGP